MRLQSKVALITGGYGGAKMSTGIFEYAGALCL